MIVVDGGGCSSGDDTLMGSVLSQQATALLSALPGLGVK